MLDFLPQESNPLLATEHAESTENGVLLIIVFERGRHLSVSQWVSETLLSACQEQPFSSFSQLPRYIGWGSV